MPVGTGQVFSELLGNFAFADPSAMLWSQQLRWSQAFPCCPDRLGRCLFPNKVLVAGCLGETSIPTHHPSQTQQVAACSGLQAGTFSLNHPST